MIGLAFQQRAVAAQDGANGIATNTPLETLTRNNETKWRETYKDELNKPVLDLIPDAHAFLPEFFQAMTLGMKEQELQETAPEETRDRGFGGSMLRETYEFVPGSLNEDFGDAVWDRAVYIFIEVGWLGSRSLFGPFRGRCTRK